MNRRIARLRQRDGISIIEVLTSMAVATIGVFGIMVMIPFAVRQSQLGLNNDAANAIGRNAIEDLQINGFLTVDNTNNLARMALPNLPANTSPAIIHFDPIGVAAGLPDFAVDGVAPLTIFAATGTTPAGNDFSSLEASRLCRSADDIAHEDDDDSEGIAPPQPIFDVDAAGTLLKRQFRGRMSWSVFLVPEKDPSITGLNVPIHRMRTHTLVYQDRFVDPTDAASLIESVYGTAHATNMVNDPVNPVSQITFPAPITEEGLGRDSWVMLINQLPEPDPALNGGNTPLSTEANGDRFRAADAGSGYNVQVMFAKVTRTNTNQDGTINSLTVDGGRFDVFPNTISTETYMLHLKNVVNVFERSIALED